MKPMRNARSSYSPYFGSNQPMITFTKPAPEAVVMVAIVVNGDYGSFRLSDLAMDFMAARKGPFSEEQEHNWRWGLCDRADPDLAACVIDLGALAHGSQDLGVAGLRIVLLPKGTPYRLQEYDGYERVLTAADLDRTA